ncbi:biotin--[acetyl-CoA-carboxylase] ligase [Gluconobacter sp. Dm-62]|uniref:biotin--[acetyl-CoA-carboxylase] ligase n=1 Tax=Gluconobacter sp. Dm-62 TaxID=2799804 RepID=UPI001B8B18D3|nr:biotin--[acetyl-CoA-carboxylase] ligase [Gluconobacter sp. Dm-62]MBS1101872.1 biotin--[acetyl-CoA-carboxylase] ligase [Gluconobacter sp. Dm-62]
MNWRFEYYETLGSTSDLCKTRAEAGEPEHLAIQAFSQTSGRGTRGRTWSDPGGNLAISLLFRPANPAAFIAALPFLIAVALYEAATHFCPTATGPSPFMVKWPNDLLLDERKMAGVLIETGGRQGRSWVVVGIGANLTQAPEIPGRRLAALSEKTTAPSARAFGEMLVVQIERWSAILAGQGFEPIRAAWLTRAHPVGTRLAVQGCETYITGSFSGLDAQGRLLLALPNGETIPVVTGDILLD